MFYIESFMCKPIKSKTKSAHGDDITTKLLNIYKEEYWKYTEPKHLKNFD